MAFDMPNLKEIDPSWSIVVKVVFDSEFLGFDPSARKQKPYVTSGSSFEISLQVSGMMFVAFDEECKKNENITKKEIMYIDDA